VSVRLITGGRQTRQNEYLGQEMYVLVLPDLVSL
jgi:hypothetical protein